MSVKFAMDGQVAIATFAAPPLNLLTIEMIEAFGDAAQAALDANAGRFLPWPKAIISAPPPTSLAASSARTQISRGEC